jgi:hypothetical protein
MNSYLYRKGNDKIDFCFYVTRKKFLGFGFIVDNDVPHFGREYILIEIKLFFVKSWLIIYKKKNDTKKRTQNRQCCQL